MMFKVLFTVLITTCGGGAQVGEMEKCDSRDLSVCVDLIPRTPIGLPRTRDELDAHCSAYTTGMSCMDTWMRRCLPTDGQKVVQQQIAGARAVMRILCNETSVTRREFLKEPHCWARVSPRWSSCVDELQAAARDITERTQLLTYFNRNAELCCARDSFVNCVSDAGRSCSMAAGKLLRGMAWILAQDVAACSPRAYCAATAVTPLVAVISSLLVYPAVF